MTAFTIRKVPDDVAAKLRVMAAQQGTSLERLVREALIRMAGELEVEVQRSAKNVARANLLPASSLPQPIGGKCSRHKRVGCTRLPECVEEGGT